MRSLVGEEVGNRELRQSTWGERLPSDWQSFQSRSVLQQLSSPSAWLTMVVPAQDSLLASPGTLGTSRVPKVTMSGSCPVALTALADFFTSTQCKFAHVSLRYLDGLVSLVGTSVWVLASRIDSYFEIHGLEDEEERDENGKSQEFSINLHNIIQT